VLDEGAAVAARVGQPATPLFADDPHPFAVGDAGAQPVERGLQLGGVGRGQ
jgi:hypothetical protein